MPEIKMKLKFALFMCFLGAVGAIAMGPERELIKQIKIEEGFRSKPYRDSRNYWSIGYGFNIEGRDLTEQEQSKLFPGEVYPLSIQAQVEYWRANPLNDEDAEYLLDQSIAITIHDAKIIFGNYWDCIPNEKRVPILDMLYNLGRHKFLKFKKCIAAIEKADWKNAAKEVRNSIAYLQAKSRYERIAKEFER